MLINLFGFRIYKSSRYVSVEAPDSLRKPCDLKSCWVRRNFLKPLSEIQILLALFVNSALNANPLSCVFLGKIAPVCRGIALPNCQLLLSHKTDVITWCKQLLPDSWGPFFRGFKIIICILRNVQISCNNSLFQLTDPGQTENSSSKPYRHVIIIVIVIRLYNPHN